MLSYYPFIYEGWRPRRTIILAFWDAHEFGSIGATEFNEVCFIVSFVYVISISCIKIERNV